ncbi:MaoC family dehydratase [Saccharomonospora sp. NB11]|jgi:acyl dehydratase|uniref:MaoC family dehydratase n=1 Tax=Saccharomonospora sp. NB11 TaxID=1642298 RepID=UPI0018D1699D|nr:MaoC family dehydratase [Saccharomonospora sp. NB11]
MSEPRTFADVEEFAAAVGQPLGTGPWHEITQEQVNLFADATDDHQWIHVDLEKAAAGPFGAPIAHGYLTLSLIPSLGADIYRIENLRMGINYGLNKVRFPQPVTVGSRIRAHAELVSVTPGAQGSQAVVKWTIEIEGVDKPACVAETVALLVA